MIVNYDVWLIAKVLNVLLLFQLQCQCQEAGEPCTVERTGLPGVCKIANDCPTGQEQAQQGISQTICGFHQLIIPIVCCENQINIISSASNLTIGNDDGTHGLLVPTAETPSLSSNSFFSGAARKSEQKCLEYSKALTDVIHTAPLVTDFKPIENNVTKCGYKTVSLIVGGSPVTAGEFPFMATLGFPDSDNNPKWRCGGTLISNRWVLTAGHCTFSRDGSEPKWVRLGEIDLTRTDESEHQDYEVDKVIPHPGYKYPIKYDDIALLSTKKEIQFTASIRPACLYTESSISQDVATATGWGQEVFSGPNSDKLLKVRLNVYDNSECTKAYRNEIEENTQLSKGIINTMLCAGVLKGGMDTCLGDSGGPLFITEKACTFHIIGVTSFGKLCGQVNTPAIYTRVSEYIEWIENTIW